MAKSSIEILSFAKTVLTDKAAPRVQGGLLPK
jgi:hypothetical protein